MYNDFENIILEEAAAVALAKIAELGASRIESELASGIITPEDVALKIAEYQDAMAKTAGMTVADDDAEFSFYLDAGLALLKEALLDDYLNTLTNELALKIAEEVAGNPGVVSVEQAAANVANQVAVAAQDVNAPTDTPAAGKLTEVGSGESLNEQGINAIVAKAVAEVTQAVANAKTNAEKTAAIAAVVEKYTTMLQASGADANTINSVVTAIQNAGKKMLAAPNQTVTQGNTVAAELLSRLGF